VPIYEYECHACGETFEAFVGVNDKPVKKCAHCKSTRIKKLVSNCSFQLKGTGWYATDYAKKDKGGEKGKDKEKDTSETAKASDVKTSEKKGDSTSSESKKSEAKAETKAA